MVYVVKNSEQTHAVSSVSPGETGDDGLLPEAIEALPYPFSVYDDQQRLLVCSRAYRDLHAPALDRFNGPLINGSISLKEVMTERYTSRLPHDEAKKYIADEIARHEASATQEHCVKTDGQWVRQGIEVTATGKIVGISFSIDELVQETRALHCAKIELERQAMHDPLTDLKNRRAVTEYLQDLCDRGVPCDFDIAVFHIDLDKFKAVNDTLGHDAGDMVICAAAEILNAAVRDHDIVARIGGDEFVIISCGIAEERHATAIAQRIVEKMAEPMEYGEDHCQIGASIGIAICRDVADLQRAMIDADIALYEAKRGGRGCFRVFASHYRARYTAAQRKVKAVTEAIELSAFEPYFQPQFCARTGELVGVEALARWIERENGVLTPVSFSPVFVDPQLAIKLDEMIFQKTLAILARWDADGIYVPRVSVNLSAHQLAQADVVDRMKWMLEAAAIPAERVGLEILEQVLASDDKTTVARNIGALKEAGLQITLDDFGTGRASIASLKELPLDRVKIDKGFCSGLTEDRDLKVITSAMIALVKNLNYEVSCVGIETEADYAILRELECDIVQGFLLGKPMAWDVFGRWMSQVHITPQQHAKSA